MAAKNVNAAQPQAQDTPEGLPVIASAPRPAWKEYSSKERALLRRIQGKKSAGEAAKIMDALLVDLVEFAGKADSGQLTSEALRPVMEKLEKAGAALMAGEEEHLDAENANDELIAIQEELISKTYPELDQNTLTNEAFIYLFKRTCAKSRGDELGN